MLTPANKLLLQDYKKAFQSYYRNNEVIDLDKKMHRKQLDYFIVHFEDVLPELGYKIPPYRHSRFAIFFISKGEGESKIGTVTLDIKDNTLLFIPAFTMYSGNFDESIRGYILSFNFNFFLQPFFPRHHLLRFNLCDSTIIPYSYLSRATGKQLLDILHTIQDEDHSDRKKKEELIALKILEMIIMCERLLDRPRQNKKPVLHPMIMQYLDQVQEHYRQEHSTSFYARSIHVHPNALNAICKKYLGRSAKAVINAVLVAESKHLLSQTNTSAKEIAFDLGFNSPPQFFRFFKQHVGLSPQQFRKEQFENVTS